MFSENFSEITDTYLAVGAELVNRNDVALLAILGGIIPALLWLWFWLKEDKRRPEPKTRLALTFLGGIITALLVLPIQFLSDALIPYIEMITTNPLWIIPIMFFIWSLSEEFGKYLGAHLTALRTKVAEEPIDIVIYMITAALGFSAFENTLYLIAPLLEGNWLASVVLLNFRFIGASLLHIASSAIIGVSLALAFYKSKIYKRLALILGLILATGLHALFNLLIINGEAIATLAMLVIVWLAVIVVLLFLEKVKKMPSRAT
jgi:RsiW-degrading membrane proteinase PrsW (M82 family)